MFPPEFSYKETVVGEKVFVSGKLKESEGFFKNIETSFKEVTNLHNNVEVKLEVTHLDRWLERMKKGSESYTQDIRKSWCGSMAPG